ncbi:hypothetical protein, partial [Mesorhizobium sp. Root172]
MRWACWSRQAVLGGHGKRCQ